MANRMDYKEMLNNARNSGLDKTSGKGAGSKTKSFKQYDNGLAILSRLGRSFINAGGFVYGGAKKVYKKASQNRTEAKSYKQSKKQIGGRTVSFVSKQAGKLLKKETYANMVNYAKNINFTKIIPSRNVVKGWNNTQFQKLDKRALAKIDYGTKTKTKKEKEKEKRQNGLSEKIYHALGSAYRPRKPIVILDKSQTAYPIGRFSYNSLGDGYSWGGMTFPRDEFKIYIEDSLTSAETLKKIERIRKFGVDTDPYTAYADLVARREAEREAKAKKDAKKAEKNDKKASKTGKKVAKVKKTNSARKYNPWISAVKRVAPFGLAALPSGLALGFTLSNAQGLTNKFNYIQARIADEEATNIARENFLQEMGNINASQWIDAQEVASPLAEKVKEQYLINYPNDLDGAQAVYDQAYANSMASSLGLSPENYELFTELHAPLAEKCSENIGELINEGWRSLGYESMSDAIEKNQDLLERALNGDTEANETWNNMVKEASAYYLDQEIFDKIKDQASEFAIENIFETGNYTDISVGEYLSAHPEAGVLGVVGALGVGVATYGVSRYLINHSSKKDGAETTAEETHSL